MEHSESEEMYLKTIRQLQEQKALVRATHIVEALGYTKGTVSLAMKRLANKEYIVVDDLGGIRLTETGEQRADEVCERGRLLAEFLMKIGADEAMARDNACRIEHVVSQELIDAVRDFLETDKQTERSNELRCDTTCI